MEAAVSQAGCRWGEPHGLILSPERTHLPERGVLGQIRDQRGHRETEKVTHGEG